METQKMHLATISILIKDRAAQAPEVNQILTKHGNIILARLGLHLGENAPENCVAVITVVIKATSQTISDLTKEIDQLYGVVAKSNILSE
ncbi:MAG TPA: CopG family transcriptional regulator [Candidatus Moranbacteria bacterium]|nr:CopG family transcriptional regulator [Candidatus Moranbacteria bacterium]HRY28108.1 CopG family transcriptional regulator [Candidatus Moranbacteria bacterium]HSA08273.1 CopG family transcriptional regulator [Candidatus Moranbacteria bacterium]